MSKSHVPAIAALALAGALSATAARAGEVNWSVGIHLPPVATVISNGPMLPMPVYVAPAPRVVVAQPAPRVIYEPAPIYYDPPQVGYRQPVRVVKVVKYVEVRPGHRHHERWVRDGRGWREVDWRDDDRRGGHDRRGEWRDGDRREMLPPTRPDWR